jgi:hypothetical protein
LIPQFYFIQGKHLLKCRQHFSAVRHCAASEYARLYHNNSTSVSGRSQREFLKKILPEPSATDGTAVLKQVSRDGAIKLEIWQ